MKITSFSVENYRSITKARKIPINNYTLLVGPNNEGKSNILHALALFMQCLYGYSWRRIVVKDRDGSFRTRMTSRQTDYKWGRDFPVQYQRTKRNLKTKITVEFELDDAEVEDFQKEIGSYLNGSLPIELSFDEDDFKLSIQKPGRGQKTLNKKAERIAQFVSGRVKFEYIPAIRTSNSAQEVVVGLLDEELRSLETDPRYIAALEQIVQLQQPILDTLGASIRGTIQSFLPSVRAVNLRVEESSRYRALRRSVEVFIDDGVRTPLDRKGDGVQSLVALSLMRHAAEKKPNFVNSIIAIEEPESHLHPNAIHELRSVVSELADRNQVVITSHSPLFVNRDSLSSNIIVHNNKAKPCSQIKELRDVLGVRFSDNLQNASLIVLVEGRSDVEILKLLLSRRSKQIADAFSSGQMQLEYLGSASTLSYKAQFYLNSACKVHAILDDDSEGHLAFEKANKEGLLGVRDVNFTKMPGMAEAEFEDLYDVNVYRDPFYEKFGVDILTKIPGKKKKWSLRTEEKFKISGKPWSGAIKAEVKSWLLAFAVDRVDEIFVQHAGQLIDAFTENLVRRIPSA